jgi:hypothetical protein
MAILSKGTDFTTGDQVTAAKLDALVDNATFASDAVDNSTTALDTNGKIIVKDGGITIAKLNFSEDSPTLRLTDTDSALSDGELSSNIEFFQSDSSGSGVGASIAAHGEGSTGLLDLRFATGANSEKMRIGQGGNVGIGTSSPEATLHVRDIGSTQPCILVEGASSSEGDIAVIDGEALQMGHWSGSSFTHRMSIISSGTVLIGRESSLNTAEDNGIALFPSGLVTIARDGTSSTSHVQFINNAAVTATVVGSISTSGSATAYNTSSDYRLKEDVIDMQDSIERVKALKPVNFAWKLDGTRVDGFLAHEAQEVVPAAVTGAKDAVDEDGQPDYQGIDQSKLVPLLTKALQEALTKIESLEARVTALES